MFGKNKGILGMVLSVLFTILWLTVFVSLIGPFNTLFTSANSTWIAFGIVIQVVPTLLYIAGTFGPALVYWKSYGIARGSGQNWLIMIVGVLEIVLFITMFSTIMSSLAAILTANITNFIAMSTIIGISPTVLFLAGIFISIGTAIGGYKGAKSKSKSVAAGL